jgi:hypothetical protein
MDIINYLTIVQRMLEYVEFLNVTERIQGQVNSQCMIRSAAPEYTHEIS